MKNTNAIGLPCICQEPHTYFCRMSCKCKCGRLIIHSEKLYNAIRNYLEADTDAQEALAIDAFASAIDIIDTPEVNNLKP